MDIFFFSKKNVKIQVILFHTKIRIWKGESADCYFLHVKSPLFIITTYLYVRLLNRTIFNDILLIRSSETSQSQSFQCLNKLTIDLSALTLQSAILFLKKQENKEKKETISLHEYSNFLNKNIMFFFLPFFFLNTTQLSKVRWS